MKETTSPARRSIKVSLLAAALSAGLPAAAAAPPPAREASERRSVDLTVYNSNLALVREERVIPLAKGGNRVVIPDVPATIDPASLHFASLTDRDGVRVLEQNYQYDLVSQHKLLEKYVGKTVEFVREDASGKETRVSGKLLSVGAEHQGGFGMPPGAGLPGLIAEIGGKVEVNPAGRLVLPSLPEGLVLKPRLEWLLNAGKGGEHKAEISYLAGSMSWSSDYVVLLEKDDARLSLTGWVTLVNQSGTAFRDAGLKLVAGDVNRVQDAEEFRGKSRMAMAAAADAEPQFQQRELFEYKLYTLQRRTDLASDESKQIELVAAKDVPARKMLVYDGMEEGWRHWLNNAHYRNQGSMGQTGNTKVGVYLAFRNDRKSGMGIPLPKGKARVYKRDDDGREQFIGEDRLDHTPKDEEIRLYMGNAFDVVGSRAQTDFRVLSSGKVVEETFQIKVRNHKKEAVEVAVHEHPWRWSQWDLVKSSVPGEKVDQTTLRFPLKIAPDQEKTVTYTIRYSW
jgi:hypothetical protein